jgi:ABC-type thiamine transport system ATPase subunit
LTPEIPSNCPQKLVELMQMCWKKQPQQRPVSSLFFFLFLFLHFTNNLICFFLD